jgi:hypothetical protein
MKPAFPGPGGCDALDVIHGQHIIQRKLIMKKENKVGWIVVYSKAVAYQDVACAFERGGDRIGSQVQECDG